MEKPYIFMSIIYSTNSEVKIKVYCYTLKELGAYSYNRKGEQN